MNGTLQTAIHAFSESAGLFGFCIGQYAPSFELIKNLSRDMMRMEPKKKKKKKKHHTPPNNGHYCRVCGDYKAHEKFSGRGHAVHICKECQRKSPAEQAEEMTLNKLNGMALRYINKEEIKWLEHRRRDSRPRVRELAQTVFEVRFPRKARNEVKKKLHINDLTLIVRGEVYNELDEGMMINTEFHADASGKIVKKTFVRNECIEEKTVSISISAMRKFFNVCVHNYEISFWDEEFGSGSDVDSLDDDDLDDDDDIDIDDDELDDDDLDDDDSDDDEDQEEYDDDDPDESDLFWSVEIKYLNGKEQTIKGSDDLPRPVAELYFDFDRYFYEDELDEELDEEFDEDDLDDELDDE
jgi:hypothetical protein